MMPRREIWAQITKQENMCLGANGVSKMVTVEEAENMKLFQIITFM